MRPAPPAAAPSIVASVPNSLVPDAPETSGSRAKTGNTALVKISSQGNLVAGAIARTSVGFMLNPITVLKARYEVRLMGAITSSAALTRQSTRYAAYRSLPAAFVDLVRTGGVRGLFQGFTATAVRDAPYAGLYLPIYEKSKDLAGQFMLSSWKAR